MRRLTKEEILVHKRRFLNVQKMQFLQSTPDGKIRNQEVTIMLHFLGIFALSYLCFSRNYIHIDFKAVSKDASKICDWVALFIIKELLKSFLG
jgi:hypothetical protein